MIKQITKLINVEVIRYENVSIGHSNNEVFRLYTQDKIFYLKYGDKKIIDLIDILTQLNSIELDFSISRVVDSGKIGDVYYVLMNEVEGIMMFDVLHEMSSYDIVNLLAKGLKKFHKIPINNISTIYTKDKLLKLANYNVKNNCYKLSKQLYYDIEDSNIKFSNQSNDILGFDKLYKELESINFSEDLVFTHGDYTLKNIILKDENIGYIDLDRAGISDRYRDIAIILNEIENVFHTKKYQSIFLKEYGIDKVDLNKLNFYLLIEELL